MRLIPRDLVLQPQYKHLVDHVTHIGLTPAASKTGLILRFSVEALGVYSSTSVRAIRRTHRFIELEDFSLAVMGANRIALHIENMPKVLVHVGALIPTFTPDCYRPCDQLAAEILWETG